MESHGILLTINILKFCNLNLYHVCHCTKCLEEAKIPTWVLLPHNVSFNMLIISQKRGLFFSFISLDKASWQFLICYKIHLYDSYVDMEKAFFNLGLQTPICIFYDSTIFLFLPLPYLIWSTAESQVVFWQQR